MKSQAKLKVGLAGWTCIHELARNTPPNKCYVCKQIIVNYKVSQTEILEQNISEVAPVIGLPYSESTGQAVNSM